MKKTVKNIIFVIVISLITLYFVFKDDFNTKIAYVFAYNKGWLLAGVLLIFLYYFLKSLVIYFCTKRFKGDYKIKKSFYTMLSVQFFNNVTPFSVGGHPYLIYRLKKEGLSLSTGTNIAIQDFIVYQIALVFLSTVAVLVNYIFNIFPDNPVLHSLVLLGFVINCLVIVFLFILSFNKKGNKFILNLVYKFIKKFNLVKDKENLKNRFDNFVLNFHVSALELMKSKWHFIKIILLNILALICLYLIPFTLIMGLGDYLNPLLVIVTSSYVMLIGSCIPLPGGTGGLEFSFIAFYGNFISPIKLASIMAIWRIITYYLGIIVGAFTLRK